MFLNVLSSIALIVLSLSASGAETSQTTTVIPFQVYEGLFGGGWLGAPCDINGRQAECKIDFGANMSSVRLSPETEVFPSKGKMRYVSVTGQKVSCDLIELPVFKLGGIEKNAYEVVRCPVVDARTDLNILGIDFFKGASLIVDYKKKEIQLAPQVPSSPLESFRVDGVGHALINVLAGHRFQPQTPTVAMVDTGAALTVVDLEFVNRFPQYFTLIKEYDRGVDTHGKKITSKLMIMSGLSLQKHVIPGEYVMAIDMTAFKKLIGQDVNFILGHNFLRSANWYFDFTNLKWTVL